MKRLVGIFLLFTILFTINYSLLTTEAYASGTISVTPQILKVDLSKDPDTASFLYKNTTGQTVELGFSIQDFKELGQDGIPGFLEPKNEEFKYGLASWLTLSDTTLLVKPGETQSLKVFIDKKRLTLGGHYASILAEVRNPGEGRDVKVKAILASLLFVRSGSEFEREEGRIYELTPDSNFFSFPERFLLKFENTGNVDVTPHGLIEVYDPFGKLVAKGVVNENSLISLPETIRKYNTQINNNSAILIPGRYSAHLTMHFGKKNSEIEKNISFYSVGSVKWVFIAGILGVILLAVLILKRGKKKTG